MSSMALMRGARILVDTCLGVKPGEQVLIVTDTNKGHIAELLASAAIERGAETIIAVMTPRKAHAQEPPSTIASAMQAADAILAPLTYSITHSKAARQALAAGARIVNLPGVTEEVFLDGSLEVDFLRLEPLVKKLADLLSRASLLEVSTPLGTNFTATLDHRPAVAQTGVCRERGTFAPPPCVMASVAPVEGTAEGIVIVDGAAVPGGLATEPFRVVFAEGRLQSIEGGKEARVFKDLLASYGDPNVYCPVQLGLGMNPKAKLGRNLLEDEGEYGTFHVGMGEGRTFGSSISAAAHVDLIVRNPTLKLNGKIVFDQGQLVFDGSPIDITPLCGT
jgi:leucyl aminopeptidase (aminopeptidase T)